MCNTYKVRETDVYNYLGAVLPNITKKLYPREVYDIAEHYIFEQKKINHNYHAAYLRKLQTIQAKGSKYWEDPDTHR